VARIRRRRGDSESPVPAATGAQLARMRLQVQRSELVHAEHHRRITRPSLSLAVGDGVELEDPVLLRFST
jgi:hypothetical protein